MAEQVNDNFDVLAGLPIEAKYRQVDIAGRDGIPSVGRYTGMQCFVEQTGVLYALIGGITNTDWQPINGAVGVGSVATYIVEGYPFIWQKGRTSAGVINSSNIMEVNDVISTGWCGYDEGFGDGVVNTLILNAIYVSGDTRLITSYNVINSQTF